MMLNFQKKIALAEKFIIAPSNSFYFSGDSPCSIAKAIRLEAGGQSDQTLAVLSKISQSTRGL